MFLRDMTIDEIVSGVTEAIVQNQGSFDSDTLLTAEELEPLFQQLLNQRVIDDLINEHPEVELSDAISAMSSAIEQILSLKGARPEDVVLLLPTHHELLKDGLVRTGKLNKLNYTFNDCADYLLHDIYVWVQRTGNDDIITESNCEYYIRKYFTLECYSLAMRDDEKYDTLLAELINMFEEIAMQKRAYRADSDDAEGLFAISFHPGKYIGSSNDKEAEMINKAALEMTAPGRITPIVGFDNYEDAADYLFLRAVNYRRNRKVLENDNCIFEIHQDIALVVYLLASASTEVLSSIKVTGAIYKKWNVPPSELMEKAMENTIRLFPPRLYTLEQVTAGDNNKEDNGNPLDPGFSIPASTMYALTDNKGTNGATALFYKGIPERLVELFGEDFYAVPSSISEVIIQPVSKISAKLVRSMAAESNPYNPPETQLSTFAFRYRSETGRLRALQAK